MAGTVVFGTGEILAGFAFDMLTSLVLAALVIWYEKEYPFTAG